MCGFERAPWLSKLIWSQTAVIVRGDGDVSLFLKVADGNVGEAALHGRSRPEGAEKRRVNDKKVFGQIAKEYTAN